MLGDTPYLMKHDKNSNRHINHITYHANGGQRREGLRLAWSY